MMDEREEARECVNVIIEYCTNRVHCRNCGIREFCLEVSELGVPPRDCFGYVDDDDD